MKKQVRNALSAAVKYLLKSQGEVRFTTVVNIRRSVTLWYGICLLRTRLVRSAAACSLKSKAETVRFSAIMKIANMKKVKGRKEVKVKVIGAGLAGCEAVWQLVKQGIDVDLYEMKPVKYSPAHSNENFAELVCSNSLKADRIENACGLLKEEMRMFDSVMMEAADLSCCYPRQCLWRLTEMFLQSI